MHKPDKKTLAIIESALQKALEELGENMENLPAEDIGKHMVCGVGKTGALSYSWKGMPILDAIPEISPEKNVHWRIFTPEKVIQ